VENKKNEAGPSGLTSNLPSFRPRAMSVWEAP